SPGAVRDRLLAVEGEFMEGVAFPTGWPELAAALPVAARCPRDVPAPAARPPLPPSSDVPVAAFPAGHSSALRRETAG
ncbi:hypothetical protein, partial [Streptomyces scabiei]|uniref:hypothetical protein n=1 Tax=Streptomyces scabiei TaxID=1930 RepID=UPI0029A9F5CE